MPAVTEQQALALLSSEVQQLPADEVLEVYNEIFPDDAQTKAQARKERGRLTQRLVDYINGGVDVAEVVELWGLIMPRHRHVWYNEEEERILYEEPEPASAE